MKIAICHNPRITRHSASWLIPWVEYCEKKHLQFGVLDGYRFDIISVLKDYDCLLWHFSGYSYNDMLFARHILYSAEQLGLAVFPDYHSAWHFDDKIAETYLLQAAEAPIPDSWVFYSYEDCKTFTENECRLPIIAKLKTGSGSQNVQMLKTKKQVLDYARKMFSAGIHAGPSFAFKAKSNLASTRNWNTMKNRAKRIPEFMRTILRSRKFPKEKGYVFFQEHIPNDGFDVKVVVVGDKLSYIGRHTRKKDFRASGGGDLFYDKKIVSKELIKSAFSISDDLKFQCMGYDFVIDSRTNEAIIVEMSYGFSHTALLEAGGYFDRDGNWHEDPLNAPQEIIANMLKQQKQKSR